MPARLLPASLQSRLSFPNGQPPRSEPAEGGTAPPGFGSVVAPKQGSLSPLRALPQYRQVSEAWSGYQGVQSSVSYRTTAISVRVQQHCCESAAITVHEHAQCI